MQVKHPGSIRADQSNVIFFGDRYVTLGEDVVPGQPVSHVLTYHYGGKADLLDLLDAFRQNELMETLHLVHGDLEDLRHALRSCFMNLEAGGGVVRNAQGAFLVIFRNGKWDLPKGKLEAGESFEVAALREVDLAVGM